MSQWNTSIITAYVATYTVCLTLHWTPASCLRSKDIYIWTVLTMIKLELTKILPMNGVQNQRSVNCANLLNLIILR